MIESDLLNGLTYGGHLMVGWLHKMQTMCYVCHTQLTTCHKHGFYEEQKGHQEPDSTTFNASEVHY